jgi:hypothetical protein
MDYLIGGVLILAPNLLGFTDAEAAAVWIPRVVGVVILLQALMTDFSVGVIKVIPLRLHLMMDYVIGLFLAVSPWLFGFADNEANAWVPHVLVGLLIFGQALVTRTRTDTRDLTSRSENLSRGPG